MSSLPGCKYVNPSGIQCCRKTCVKNDSYCSKCTRDKLGKEISETYWKINTGPNIQYPKVRYQISEMISKQLLSKSYLENAIVNLESEIALGELTVERMQSDMERIKNELEKYRVNVDYCRQDYLRISREFDSLTKKYIVEEVVNSSASSSETSFSGSETECTESETNCSNGEAEDENTDKPGANRESTASELEPPVKNIKEYYVDAIDFDGKKDVVIDLLTRLNNKQTIILAENCNVESIFAALDGKIPLDTQMAFLPDKSNYLAYVMALRRILKNNARIVVMSHTVLLHRPINLDNVDVVINFDMHVMETYTSCIKELSLDNKPRLIINLVTGSKNITSEGLYKFSDECEFDALPNNFNSLLVV